MNNEQKALLLSELQYALDVSNVGLALGDAWKSRVEQLLKEIKRG